MVKTDLTTKILLFAIAVALWGLLLKPSVVEIELFKSAQAGLWGEDYDDTQAQYVLNHSEEISGLSGVDLSNYLLIAIRENTNYVATGRKKTGLFGR